MLEGRSTPPALDGAVDGGSGDGEERSERDGLRGTAKMRRFQLGGQSGRHGPRACALVATEGAGMQHRPLGRTGVSVSQFCLGTMMFGSWGNPDHEESIRIIHAALDAGINF